METLEIYLRMRCLNEALGIVAWPMCVAFCVLILATQLKWKQTITYNRAGNNVILEKDKKEEEKKK
jgi:hypothetical protein